MSQAIFLSYASQDADAARRICDTLRAAGLEVWFDQSELRGGDAWDASIRKQIKECALFVPMISSSTNARAEGYFRLEWKLAVDRSHLMADDQPFFLPVILDDSLEPAARVPDKFRERQWSRLNDEETIAAFAARASKLLAGRASPSKSASNGTPVLASLPIGQSLLHKSDEGFWVGVLPFKYRGSNADLAALAEGLYEDIVTGLSRFSYVRVIARSATSPFTGDMPDVRAVGKELGARYLMDGMVRQSGAALRVAVQLIDVESGANLWAETYNRAFATDDIFALQDDLVPRIVSTIADAYGVLPRSMSNALRNRAIDRMTPYEALIRSFGHYERVAPEEHAVVRDCLERAVAMAPTNSDCLAALAMIYAHEYGFGLNPRPDSLTRALDAATRAVEFGPANHTAFNALAMIQHYRKEFQASRHAADRAMTLNPMDASTNARMGLVIAYAGDWETGCANIERARQLNPNHADWYWAPLCINAYRQGDYRGALTIARNIKKSGYYNIDALVVASYGQLGEQEAASKALHDLTTLRPEFPANAREQFSARGLADELVEHVIEGLRKGGMDTLDESAILRQSTAPSGAAVIDTANARASIAVLAFANRSASADDEYFSDGLADELLNVLAKIKGLRVAARTSAFSFKGKSDDIATIGQKLNVATVLEGSVRKSGNRVRISVQLIKVDDGFQLWSETYDRTLDDIFAVQDDIAQSVVKELRTTLLSESPAPQEKIAAEIARAASDRSENSEAQRLFLQGHYLLGRKSEAELMRSIDYFKQAVALDPHFALAWAWLAQAYCDAGDWGTSPLHEAYANASVVASQALALAPDLVQAHTAMASFQIGYQWDWAQAKATIKRALQLAPSNADVLTVATQLAFCLNRLDAAEAYGLNAVAVDPLNAGSYRMLAMVGFAAGKLGDAVLHMRHSLALAPEAIASRHVMSYILAALGRFDEALAEAMLEKAEWARLTSLTSINWAINTVSSRAESDAALAQLIEKHGGNSAIQISASYAMRGDADAAFMWLERAYAQRDSGTIYIKVLPFYHLVTDDARYLPFLKKMGLDG